MTATSGSSCASTAGWWSWPTPRRRLIEARALARLWARQEPALAELPASGADFWRAVRSLPRRQAQAVALHYLEDLPVAGSPARTSQMRRREQPAMTPHRTLLTTGLAGLLGLVPLAPPAPAPANVEVVATGLIYPRGLDFDPDGQLCVAEHGYGGDPSAGRTLRIRLG